MVLCIQEKTTLQKMIEYRQKSGFDKMSTEERINIATAAFKDFEDASSEFDNKALKLAFRRTREESKF